MKITGMLLIATIPFSFTACGGGDDEPDVPNVESKITAKSFIGRWYNHVSYGGVTYTFNEDGTCSRYISSQGWNTEGKWTFDAENMILSTTLDNDWTILSVSEISWTGMLHSSKQPVFTYTKKN